MTSPRPIPDAKEQPDPKIVLGCLVLIGFALLCATLVLIEVIR